MSNFEVLVLASTLLLLPLLAPILTHGLPMVFAYCWVAFALAAGFCALACLWMVISSCCSESEEGKNNKPSQLDALASRCLFRWSTLWHACSTCTCITYAICFIDS
jgi:hypothetical protein